MVKGFGDSDGLPAGTKCMSPGPGRPKPKTLTSLQIKRVKIHAKTKDYKGKTETEWIRFELRADGKVWVVESDYVGSEKPAVRATKEWVNRFDIGFRCQYDVVIALLKRWYEDWSD